MCASGLVSPAAALALGLIFGFGFTHPWQAESRTATKYLLQASVVGLGFGMNLHEVLRAGRSGFVYTAVSIAFALTAGLLAGRVLGGDKTAGGEQDGWDFDHGGDGDLRGERDCGGGADYSCGSGRDGGFARDDFYFECDCFADFSAAGVAAAFVAATIWIVGGAGDS